MPAIEIQPVPVVVAGVVTFLLGGLWFGPFFGRPWATAVGIDPDAIHPSVFLVGGLTYLLLAAAISLIGGWVGLSSVLDGLVLGFAIWLGVAFALGFNVAAFAGRPMSALTIEAGYQLVACLLVGGILGGWS